MSGLNKLANLQQMVICLLAITGGVLAITGLIKHDIMLDSVGGMELFLSYLSIRL